MTRKNNGPQIQVPRDILSRVRLGQAFAEYDRELLKPGIVVKTPALLAAEDDDRGKCFFVGRRGTGKTAIALHLSNRRKHVVEIHPELFATVGTLLKPEELKDTRQPPVRALISCLRRALLDETFKFLADSHQWSFDQLPKEFRSERGLIEDFDFDTRAYHFIEEAFVSLSHHDQKSYLKQISRTKKFIDYANDQVAETVPKVYLLIDRVDDSWDGSDTAVVLLMALMHACLEITTQGTFCRPLLFLRENIFQRVREIDTEFARLQM